MSIGDAFRPDEEFITHVTYEASCQEKNQPFLRVQLSPIFRRKRGPSATWTHPKINFSINDPINMSDISDWTRNFSALFIDAGLRFRLARHGSRDNVRGQSNSTWIRILNSFAGNE